MAIGHSTAIWPPVSASAYLLPFKVKVEGASSRPRMAFFTTCFSSGPGGDAIVVILMAIRALGEF